MATTATITGPEQIEEGRVQDRGAFTTRSPEEASRRRFTIAVVTGTALTMPLMLWLLWDLWNGKVNVIRGVSFDYFYDRQARAMLHGHLWIPPGQLSIEAFHHAGREFTYFGIFPSLIRMPVLLFTSRLDGDLTAPSLLLAWIATAVFTALLLWRLRVLIRGTALVGRAEAASYGVLMAGVMGGSVVIYLAATPFVYNEDFAWSIPLVLGSLFVLLGIQERPSWGRMTAAAVLVVCANLNRTPGGYAVTIGCFLVAAWFALGKGGTTARRWAIPLAAIGLVGFLFNAAVTYAKFGIPVGLPMQDQVWTHAQRVPPPLPRRQRRKAGEPRPYPEPVVGLLPALRSPLLHAVPVHHPTWVTRRFAQRGGDGVDLPDGQHDHDGTVAHRARRLGGGDGVPAAGSRSCAPGTAHPGHRGRGNGRGRRVGLHLPAVHRGLHAASSSSRRRSA